MSAEENDARLALNPGVSMAVPTQQAPNYREEATIGEDSLGRGIHMNRAPPVDDVTGFRAQTMNTNLCIFVMRGYCGRVKELLGSNLEIMRGVAPQGDSALHIAAARGHHEIVELLVTQMPCMLLMRNSNKETPLHAAARSGQTKVVEVLLNVQNRLPCNCKSSSCPKRTDLEASPIEVEEIWRAQNNMGETALHSAVRGNSLEVVEQLLDKGIGIECIVNNEGESPLYRACCYGCVDIGKRLLLLDPAIGDTRNDGTNCLHQAIITILQWWDEDNNYLRQWQDFAVDLACELVSKRPQLAEAVDPSGNSPLHLLVALPNPNYENHPMLLRDLVQAKPNMNFILNNDDMAPIHIAARDGNSFVIYFLLSGVPHCSYMLGKKKKKNALHFALEHNDGSLLLHKVETLLEDSVDKGFLINEPDSQGKTALSIASETLVGPLKYVILDRMLGKSSPGPNISTKNKASKSSQLDIKKEVATDEAKGDQSKENVEGKDPKERLSVIAALIATISFAAAFTIPGGLNQEKGIPVLWHEAALKTFILFDSLALSLSIMSLLQLIYRPSAGVTGVYKLIYRTPANIQRFAPKNFEKYFARWWRVHALKNFDQELTRWGRRYLFWSLNATMVAFAAGVYVVVAPKCEWLALSVCIITLGSLLLESIIAPILKITFQPILRILLLPMVWLALKVPRFPFYWSLVILDFYSNLSEIESADLFFKEIMSGKDTAEGMQANYNHKNGSF